MQDFVSLCSARWAGLPRLFAAVSAIALMAVPARGQEPPDSVRSLLTPEEFRRAGLEKLTPDELSFLNACLARLRSSPAQATALPRANSPSASASAPVRIFPQGEAAFGIEEQLHAAVEILQAVPSAIRSRAAGAFQGWRGRTEFHLENGQVWRQVEPGEFSVSLTQPVIVIEKGLMGAFYLHVEGYGARVKVRRAK